MNTDSIRFEFKADLGIDDAGTITGIAWPFGVADRIGDTITKGAFGGIDKPLPMLFGHNVDDVVGIWDTASEAADGLDVKGRLLIDVMPRAREVHAMVKNKIIGGLSIGFQILKASGRKGHGRTISALKLAEVSLVSVPMHPGARVLSAKSTTDEAIALAELVNRAARRFREI